MTPDISPSHSGRQAAQPGVDGPHLAAPAANCSHEIPTAADQRPPTRIKRIVRAFAGAITPDRLTGRENNHTGNPQTPSERALARLIRAGMIVGRLPKRIGGLFAGTKEHEEQTQAQEILTRMKAQTKGGVQRPLDVGRIIGVGGNSHIHGAAWIQEDGSKIPSVLRVNATSKDGYSDRERHVILAAALGKRSAAQVLPRLLGEVVANGKHQAVVEHSGISLDKAIKKWHQETDYQGLTYRRTRRLAQQFAQTANALRDMVESGITFTDIKNSNFAIGHHLQKGESPRAEGRERITKVGPLKLVDFEGLAMVDNRNVTPLGTDNIFYTPTTAPPELIANKARAPMAVFTGPDGQLETRDFRWSSDREKAEAMVVYQLGQSLVSGLLTDRGRTGGRAYDPVFRDFDDTWVSYAVARGQRELNGETTQQISRDRAEQIHRLIESSVSGNIDEATSLASRIYEDDYHRMGVAFLHGGLRGKGVAKLTPEDLKESYDHIRNGEWLTPVDRREQHDRIENIYGKDIADAVRGATRYHPQDRISLKEFSDLLSRKRSIGFMNGGELPWTELSRAQPHLISADTF